MVSQYSGSSSRTRCSGSATAKTITEATQVSRNAVESQDGKRVSIRGSGTTRTGALSASAGAGQNLHSTAPSRPRNTMVFSWSVAAPSSPGMTPGGTGTSHQVEASSPRPSERLLVIP